MNNKSKTRRWAVGDGQFIQRHANLLAKELPKPHTPFIYTDVGLDMSVWKRLTESDLLSKEGTAADHPDFDYARQRGDIWVWEVPEDLHTEIQGYVKDTIHPCAHKGHHGVRNVRGGQFSCRNDECDVEFDRETARKLIESL